MKKIIYVLALLVIPVFSYSQVQQAWVARANGVENKDEFGGHIARDAAGFIYVAGSRQNTADDGNSGFLTIKYNPVNGAVIWAHINDGSGNGRAGPSDLCVDPAGNVYVTGGGGPTSHGTEWFTIKYNTNGAQVWENSYTNSSNGESAAAIAVDAQGNVFVTGHSYTDAGVSSITTIKYDAAGTRKWIRYYNGTDDPGGASGRDIAVDAAGNVYVTGSASYTGTNSDLVILKYDNNGNQLSSNRYDGLGDDTPVSMVLDPSGNIFIAAVSIIQNHSADFLTLKYNSNCNIIWERLYNGIASGSDGPSEIAVDGSGNVFIGGSTSADHNNNGRLDKDFLLIKYDINGNKLWDVTYNSSGFVHDDIQGLALDVTGNIYVTGFSGDLGSSTALVDYVTIKYNTNGVQQWLKTYDGPAGFSDYASDILVDPNGNIYVTGTSARTPADDDIATVKYTQCELICPANITTNKDPGKCSAIVNFNSATYTGDCGNSFTYSHNTGIEFPVGVTTVTATSDATGASCSFTITVVDNQLPDITCPSNKTVNTDAGVCYATAASVNAGTASASDNCNPVGVTGVRSDGISLSANYPVGVTTILWTATDPSLNTSTCTQTITVVDNVPPTIAGESASTYLLSPSNHKMRDVTLNYIVTDNCSATTVITVTSNEPINGVGDGDTDPDWIVLDNYHVQLRAERSANGSGRIYTIYITATDPYGNMAVKTLEVRVPHNIKGPNSGQPFIVNSTVNFNGEFWDKPSKRHTAKWLLDGTVAANGVITEPTANKNGKVTGSYKFTSAGVYKLQMNVTDQNGVMNYSNTNGDLDAIVVIYDPNGGYTYGGGWFESNPGALAGTQATGKASYGFAINYRNAAKPKGETQFEFKVGTFEFNALNFDYLVVSGYKAQFRGTGKIIGGQSGINFIMTVIDGRLDGTGVDKIRLKIYKNNGQVIYDNQPGASDAEDPVQPVGDNSIIYVDGKQAMSLFTQTKPALAVEELLSDKLELMAFPNPSDKAFTIRVNSGDMKEKIIMQVIDQHGRVLETRNNLAPGAVIKLGQTFKPGIYYLKIMQGKKHEEIKLIKL